MVGVDDLLRRARAAGLALHVEGERLVVRGPKRHEVLAREVLAHKDAVRIELTIEAAIAIFDGQIVLDCPSGLSPEVPSRPRASGEMPTAPCRCCAAVAWRQQPGGWVCNVCHPERQERTR